MQLVLISNNSVQRPVWMGGGGGDPHPTPPQKSSNFQGPLLPMSLEMDLPPSKSLRPLPYKQVYINSYF